MEEVSVVKAEVPVLEVKPMVITNSLDKVEAVENKKYGGIDLVVRPAYVWKTGTTFFLSKREQIIADTFLETRSYAECARRVTAECKKKLSAATCKKWLEGKEHVAEYLAEQVEERGMYAGWTKEHWMYVMTKHLQGHERLATGDLYGMNLIARVKGWEMEKGTGLAGVSINILQQNGRP